MKIPNGAPKAEKGPEKKPGGVSIISESEKNEDLFKELVEIDGEIFPGMKVEESELRESFYSEGIQVALRSDEGKMIGYLTSLPHNQAKNKMIEDDPELVEYSEAIYVESIGILEENRSIDNFLKIWNSFCKTAIDKGYKKITGHFRVSGRLSHVLQKNMVRNLEEELKIGVDGMSHLIIWRLI